MTTNSTEIRSWKQDLQHCLSFIKECIDNYTKELLKTHQENFSLEANKHNFKTYILKSKSNNLTVEDLRKGLNTPNKYWR
jgi:serine/threonine protein phosphatase 1